MSSVCGVFPMVFFSQITHRPVRVRATCFSAAFVPCALDFSKPQLNRGFRRNSCGPDYQLWLRRDTDKPFALCRNASFDDYASGVPSVSSSLGTLGLVRCVEIEAAWPIRPRAQARQAKSKLKHLVTEETAKRCAQGARETLRFLCWKSIVTRHSPSLELVSAATVGSSSIR